MALVELARLRESSVKAHHIYRTVFLVGEVLICERKLSNCHCDWVIVVKKPETREVAGHVPDDLVCVLFPLLTAGKVLPMKCDVTGFSKAVEEGV